MSGTEPRTELIAEAGVNHNGDIELAVRMIDEAARAGATAVKFQTFRAERLVSEWAATAGYQRTTTGFARQAPMLRALELSEEDHARLVARCAQRGIEFLSTAFDEESLDFLLTLGMKRIKIPSGEITNHPYLRHAAGKRLPILLSTGMADLAEVASAVEQIRGVWSREHCDPLLTILHCTSSYPTQPEDANLRALLTLREHFGTPVGYSDHTAGIQVAIAAVALGATVIEKHVTLDRTLPGPDHRASLDFAEFEKLALAVREVERAMGDGRKAPRPVELPVRELVRRGVAVRTDLPAGHRLTAADLIMLRPAEGISPQDAAAVIGRTLKGPLQAGAHIRWTDLA